jgi:hypothetical protein
MMAFFLIDGGAMRLTSNTQDPALPTVGTQRQRNEAVHLGWDGLPSVHAHAYPVAIPNLPSIQELVSQDPGFPTGLAPTGHPLQPQAQCEPLIRPDSAPPSPEECDPHSYGSGDINAYEPEDLDTYEPHADPRAQGEVELPPAKRSRPFAGGLSPADLADLHRFTTQYPPQVRVFDLDKIRLQFVASQNRRQVQRNAESSMEAVPPGPPNVMLVLQTKKSFVLMVKYVKTWGLEQSRLLLVASREWKERNPPASQLMALLFLFTLHSPPWEFAIEFPHLLPATWPPALEPLRQDCLTSWRLIVRTDGANDATMRRSIRSMLKMRYSKPAPPQGLFAGMSPEDVIAVLHSAMLQL